MGENLRMPKSQRVKTWPRVCKNCQYRGSADHHAFCTMTEQYVPRKHTCELYKPLKGRE